MKLPITMVAMLLSFNSFGQEKITVTQNVPYDNHKSCVMDIAQKELIIKQKNGKSIYGIVSNPDTKGKHGVAITSHGFNGTHHFGKDYFKTLNDLGYAVYSFDFPCGSVNSKSDNNTMNMSVSDEKDALKEIVAYFRKQKDVDKN